MALPSVAPRRRSFSVLLIIDSLHLTAPHWCLRQVTWDYNANLGRFTNFVNLLDMAGIAVPSGLLRRELPAP